MRIHWMFKVPELWAVTLVLSCFGYTGALDAEKAVISIVTAASCIFIRRLLK